MDPNKPTSRYNNPRLLTNCNISRNSAKKFHKSRNADWLLLREQIHKKTKRSRSTRDNIRKQLFRWGHPRSNLREHEHPSLCLTQDIRQIVAKYSNLQCYRNMIYVVVSFDSYTSNQLSEFSLVMIREKEGRWCGFCCQHCSIKRGSPTGVLLGRADSLGLLP